jgi:hypothetical protein
LARAWHLLIDPSGLQPFPPYRFVSVLRLLPTLITISSSSINPPVTHARLTCSLPYTWASMPYIRTDPIPFRVVAGSKPRASPSSNFTILYFLPRTTAYTTEQVHQQTSSRSHLHNGIRIRIRSSTFLGRLRIL